MMDMDRRSVAEESMKRFSLDRQILPTVGACAVFSIDPVASLDSDVQNDADAVAACKKLVTKKYVGLISSRPTLYTPYARFNPCIVRFILQGEPPTIPDRCIEPSMSIPMIPMTVATHPSARDPMKPSKPLPWNDCYVSCYTYAQVRSRTTFTRDPIDYTFDVEEMSRHDWLLGKDVQRKKVLLRAKGAAQTAQSTLLVDANVRKTGAETEKRGGLATGLERTSAGTTSGAQTPADKAVASTSSLEDPEPPLPDGAVTVIFSHDLSTAEELTDPADYFKEVEAIVRIQEEAWPRVVAAKARATKGAMRQAERINAQAYDDHTVDLLIERTTFRGRASRLTSKIKAFGSRIVHLTRLRRNK
ncbi:hypothetical protein C8R46DRAFT_1183562 [Mycena filopes]|nr:hypothetical protein C8R46DRAFT_1183562 [Mycena filopes]